MKILNDHPITSELPISILLNKDVTLMVLAFGVGLIFMLFTLYWKKNVLYRTITALFLVAFLFWSLLFISGINWRIKIIDEIVVILDCNIKKSCNDEPLIDEEIIEQIQSAKMSSIIFSNPVRIMVEFKDKETALQFRMESMASKKNMYFDSVHVWP